MDRPPLPHDAQIDFQLMRVRIPVDWSIRLSPDRFIIKSDVVPPEREDGAHRSITEFAPLEALAFGEEEGGASRHGRRPVYRHLLVQSDGDAAREYVVVHAVCLDRLEERVGDASEWTALEWADSQAFLEQLLAPAARPPHLLHVDWAPGDVVLFDNLQTQHSVTPTDAYATTKGARRLMTRTAMQPAVDMLR